MITKTFARIEDGKLRLEADVIPTIAQDQDRRLIFLDMMISYATKAQQEVFAMLDSEAITQSDLVCRRMMLNETLQKP